MKKVLLSSLTAASLALVASQPCYAEANAQERHSDTWLEASIMTAYTLNRHLNPFEIDADVVDGTATLSGEVNEKVDKALAEEIAKSIDGVSSVDNEIRVVPSTGERMKKEASSTRNSFLQSVDDATTTTRVKSKLLWNGNTEGTSINVDTKNGIVTLNGTVDTAATSELAERLAENTSGVRDVENKLTVASKDSRAKLGTVNLDKVKDNADSVVDDVASDVSDVWIQTKIGSALTFTRGLDSGDISVTSEKGSVTLRGYARTDAEKALAEEVAKDIKGVRSVDNELKVRS